MVFATVSVGTVVPKLSMAWIALFTPVGQHIRTFFR